jgi:hypothetical protein
MKFLYAIYTAILLTFGFQGDVPYTALEKAFSSHNSTDIVELGKDKILLNILDKEGAYSRSQAGMMLKDFFSKKPCSEFKFIFKSKETSDGCFAIGTYESKGEGYRVTIHFKKESSSSKIETLTIQK